MRISEVSVPVRSLDEATAHYDRLGFAIDREQHVSGVRIGTTRLVLTEAPGARGDIHLAFLIPNNKFDAAKAWLRERADLIDLDGQDEFECSPAWNAHSVYFDGPDGAVLEVIARRELDNDSPGPFSAADFLAVSEVGIAVSHVEATAEKLKERAGIEPYGATVNDSFTPVGDIDGLLILVSPSRTWFPTTDRRAEMGGVRVVAEGAIPQRVDLDGLGALTLV
jgi:catechol 2,3-dioxygenase-like lactoylglutathione lyase family enzyme